MSQRPPRRQPGIGSAAATKPIFKPDEQQFLATVPWTKSPQATILWIIAFAVVRFVSDRTYAAVLPRLFPLPPGMEFNQHFARHYGVTMALIVNGVAQAAMWLPVLALFWLVRDPLLPGKPATLFPHLRLPTWRDIAITVGWALVGLAAVLLFNYARTTLNSIRGIPKLEDITDRQAMGAVKLGKARLYGSFSVVIVPTLETWVFQGVLFGILRASLLRSSHARLRAHATDAAIVVSSSLFAAIHSWPRFWECFAVGAIFCWVYKKSARLSAAVGAHSLVNLGGLLETIHRS